MKRIILVLLLLLGIVIVSASSMVYDHGELFRKEDMIKGEIRKGDLETYKITQFNNNNIFVRVCPDIKTLSDLINYKKNRTATQNYISRHLNPDTPVDVVITFNDSLSTKEYNSFMKKYGLRAENYMYKSYPEGTGVYSSEIPYEEIIAAEKAIQKTKGSEFKLVDKIVSVRTQIPAKDIMQVQKDPQVFLADVGPKDIYQENPNSKIRMTMDYLYHVYSKLPR